MKLVQKLTFALLLGMCAILATNGYFRVVREVAAMRADRERDLALIGAALSAAVDGIWRTDGRARAIALIETVNARGGRIHARYVDVASGEKIRIADGELKNLAPGDSITRIAANERGEQSRFTYTPVSADADRNGALELSESVEQETLHTATIVRDTVLTTLMLLVVSGVVAVIFGVWLVGRPVRALAEKARRIGRGDFSAPIVLTQNDELSELAAEMNAMCDRLVEANERARTETAARIATLEQLRHADRLMTVGKLASGIAHELGTPLNVISARAGMIAGGETSGAETTEYAGIIVEATNRMTRIIRQLLEFARRRPAQRTPKDLREIARGTLALLEALARKRGVDLVLSGEGGAVTLGVDIGQIQQAITNLVVNAVQATAPADHASPAPKTVTVSVGIERASPPAERGGPEAEYVFIRVHDQGEGIPKETIAHIFEPFFTTKGVGDGTGLGLSVTYGIVQDHGGWIVVDSEVGKGSVFTVYLPRRGDA